MTPSPRESWNRDARHIGRRVLAYDWLPSTNDLALAINEPGTAIVADVQTAGRGQYDRTWQSRPGASLLLSVTLSPPANLNRAVTLIAWAAVAVSDAIQTFTGQPTTIKWPNDLLLDGKKVCGILTEQRTVTVIGIGLNLNQTADEFIAAKLPGATSLALVAGRRFNPMAVLLPVLDALDDTWHQLLTTGPSTLETEWKQRIGLIGEVVRLDLMDGTTVTGRLVDMSFDSLVLDGTAIVPERVRQMKPA